MGRRQFLGRVGKAGVATAIAMNGLKLNVLASGSGHCPPHGDKCKYVTSISVHFTSRCVTPTILNDDNSVRWKSSGYRYTGTMTVNWAKCYGFSRTGTVSYEVMSGGHIALGSTHVQLGDDTCIPSGNHTMRNSVDLGDQGFYVNGNGRVGHSRTEVQVHGPGVTTGCIAFVNIADWSEFYTLVTSGNVADCIHEPPTAIPLAVTYAAGITPNGNNPF